MLWQSYFQEINVKTKSINVNEKNTDTRLVKTEPTLFNRKDLKYHQPKKIFDGMIRALNTYSLNNPIKKVKNHSLKLKMFLMEHPEVKLVQADKNLGLVALNTIDYHNYVKTHLDSNHYTYIEAATKPNSFMPSRTYSRVKSKYLTLIENLVIDKDTRKDLKNLKSATLPKFHCLPKIHKWYGHSKPTRPIVGATNWWTTPISKLLSKEMKPYLKAEHLAINTEDVTKALDNFNESNSSPFSLVTLDVSSLYTNINLNTLESLISTYCTQNLLQMLQFINKCNYFTYNEKIYLQTDGIAMGTNAAPELANFYLIKLLDPIILNQPKVKFYRRYLDDLFIIWIGTKEELTTFHNELNNAIENIILTIVHSPSEVDYLDLKIGRSIIFDEFDSRDIIVYQTHQKPLNKYAYIGPNSRHPRHLFKSFINAELNRYSRNSSYFYNYYTTKLLFFTRLLKRGYSRKYLTEIFRNHKFVQEKRNDDQKTEAILAPFIIRYSNRSNLMKFTRRIKFILTNRLPEFVKNPNVLICWESSKSLRSHLLTSDLTKKQSLLIAKHEEE